MKTLLVSAENRSGHTLRGVVTLPDSDAPVPFVLNLHGFASSLSGRRYMHTSMARALAAAGIGCARFDFFGCGESDGEFSELSFDGLYTDTEDLFAWLGRQPYADAQRIFLSGQSMGGYIAASNAPKLNPRGLILMCPGAAMWYGCEERAAAVEKSGTDEADMQGLVYKMSFNHEMARHPEPFEEAKGYEGPVLLLRADDDPLVSEQDCLRYQAVYRNADFIRFENGGHDFACLPARNGCNEAICSFVRTHL